MTANKNTDAKQPTIPPRLAKAFVKVALLTAIEEGKIDVKNKSKDEVDKLFCDYMDSCIKSGKYFWSVDHTPSLLNRARQHRRDGEAELAAVFYATWIEHWINWLLRRLALRKKLSAAQIGEMLRSTQMRGKLSWLLALAGGKPLPKAHFDLIQRLSDARNAFVHYKWVMESIEAPNQTRSKLVTDLAAIEKTISYLNRYGSRLLRPGASSSVQGFFK